MKSGRNVSWLSAVACMVLASVLGSGLRTVARPQSLPNPASIVKATPYVSIDPVPQGKAFEAAIVMEISAGFHMNSHKPSEDFLIPTTLTPNPPAGITVVDTIYPVGQLKKFTFSPNKPLDVYTGSVMLRLKLQADREAPMGSATMPLTLRYQACNDTACLPPVKIPVTIQLNVVAAGATPHKVHPDIFSPADGTTQPSSRN
jgi:DsbC/DsbD-like thiol-disulfide interchange protein